MATLGMAVKWAIHPSQVVLANEVFSPGEAEVAAARRIFEAMREAERAGAGAVMLENRLIDIASIRQAEVILKREEMIRGG